MGNFTLCEMLKSLPLDSCHPILVAKQDPGSRCFQSADCFWVLPVAKMLWDEVVKKTLIHRHLGVTCLIFRHFMSLSITFCCSFCMENMWNRLHTSSFCDSLTWFGDEQYPFLTSSSRTKIGPWPVGWLWNAVNICESAPAGSSNTSSCELHQMPLAARQASVASACEWLANDSCVIASSDSWEQLAGDFWKLQNCS